MHIFVSDVHLGSKLGNPAKRESEFIKFLKELPKETKTLFLLGLVSENQAADGADSHYRIRCIPPPLCEIPPRFCNNCGENLFS